MTLNKRLAKARGCVWHGSRQGKPVCYWGWKDQSGKTIEVDYKDPAIVLECLKWLLGINITPRELSTGMFAMIKTGRSGAFVTEGTISVADTLEEAICLAYCEAKELMNEDT